MFPLGSKLEAAREALTIYEARNIRREDFDADKIRSEQGMTVAKWPDCYFDLRKSKRNDLWPGTGSTSGISNGTLVQS